MGRAGKSPIIDYDLGKIRPSRRSLVHQFPYQTLNSSTDRKSDDLGIDETSRTDEIRKDEKGKRVGEDLSLNAGR